MLVELVQKSTAVDIVDIAWILTEQHVPMDFRVDELFEKILLRPPFLC